MKSFCYCFCTIFSLFGCSNFSSPAGPTSLKVDIPASLEARREEFEKEFASGYDDLLKFAKEHQTEHLMSKPLVFKAVILSKADFDKKVRELEKLPADYKVSESFVAAPHGNIFWVVTPEEVKKLTPKNIEEGFYSKLYAHELAHLLHIRYLDGREEEMGPTWFFEGFAAAAAGQYEGFIWDRFDKEFENVIRDPKRGDYRKYALIFRKLLNRHDLKSLLDRGKDPKIDDWAIAELRKIEKL